MWPLVENPDLVLLETGDPKPDTFQASSMWQPMSYPDHPNRMVSHSRGLTVDMHQEAPTSNRSICNKVQQTTLVCVTNSRLPNLRSRCTHSSVEGLSNSSHSGQGGGEM